MKRILSVLLVVAMLAVSAVLMIPTSAATTEETKTYTPDWLEHKNNQMFEAFKSDGSYFDLGTFWNYFSITRETNLLSAGLSTKLQEGVTAPESTYLSKIRFDITETTKYEYTLKAKSNVTSRNSNNFAGVPFAISSDNVAYTAYGNFNNTNAFANSPSTTQSFIITIHGGYKNRDPYVDDSYMSDSKYFETLELDSEGFASLKIVYEGLDVTIYAKNSAGTFVQMGQTVTLAEGSQVAFGLFSRDSSTKANRTASIKDAKITALNEESVEYMEDGEAGFNNNNNSGEDDRDLSALEDLLYDIEINYVEEDYTPESWAYLESAINQAELMLNDTSYSQDDVDVAVEDLQYAMDCLEVIGGEEEPEITEPKETEPQQTEPQQTEPQQTEPKETEPKQTEPKETEPKETESKKESVEDEEEETESEEAGKKVTTSCGGAVATTAVIVGIVTTLGAALVVKKKD